MYYVSVATFLVVISLTSTMDKAAIEAELAKPIIGPRTTLNEAVAFCKARLPKLPTASSAAEWDRKADELRQAVLATSYFRGQAAEWRKAKTKAVWLETIAGGPGYRIKKLRYEVVPGLWIPALLYEPEKLAGKTPVHLAVNGHDAKGKSVDYKQVRCINLAKRGMIVLNLEWFGMGQLRSPGYHHGRLDQLNLCGTSGLSPFFLAMSRGIDILLEHPSADPERLAVHGLSGGGWQTITISALDTRVKLCNPVAGYSGFRTRLEHFKDLGDSEQTPCDLGTRADYTHFTAMLAPRPTLLTYNAKDQCCFESVYALEPLLDAARPTFKLHNTETRLRSHVNQDPGTHNFLKDNRQALYRMVGDFFYSGDKSYSAEEIPSESEIKTAEQLNVELPKNNATFQTLALDLASRLPRDADFPKQAGGVNDWQKSQSMRIAAVVPCTDEMASIELQAVVQHAGFRSRTWIMKTKHGWSVPVVELAPPDAKWTTVLLGDGGRKSLTGEAERLLKAGHRVLATDVFYFGETKIVERDYLMALMISTVGQRPLGVQAGQLAAVQSWAQSMFGDALVNVVAMGPRTGVISLIVAALHPATVANIEINNPLASLKQVIEENRSVEQCPELFCFGLLEVTDVARLIALSSPTTVHFRDPSPRAVEQLTKVERWRRTVGKME